MKTNPVNDWFNSGCDYTAGVALYAAQKGMKPNLLKLFGKGPSVERLAKLTYELGKVRAAPNAVVKVPAVTKKVVPVAVKPAPAPPAPEKKPLYYHNLPEELRPVLQEAYALFNEICLLKVRLNELAPEQEAEALAIQLSIYEKRKKNGLCWKQIDYWKQYGKTAPRPADSSASLTPAGLVKRQQHLFSSISRLKKRYAGNIEKLKAADSVREKSRLERAMARQEKSLIQQESELMKITKIISPVP